MSLFHHYKNIDHSGLSKPHQPWKMPVGCFPCLEPEKSEWYKFESKRSRNKRISIEIYNASIDEENTYDIRAEYYDAPDRNFFINRWRNNK